MKFYHSTATCSTVSHIVLTETNTDFTPVEVSWKRDLNVAELAKVNSLGAVPALALDDGRILTQNATILEYLADAKPEANLLAKFGSSERLATMSWVTFASADLQKAYAPFFIAGKISGPDSTKAEVRDHTIKAVSKYLDYIETNLAGKDFIVGKNFTIADAALFVFIGWSKWIEVKTAPYKNITAYMKRIYARPAVRKVLESEGLSDFLQN
jgi:glutathione S-transferase